VDADLIDRIYECGFAPELWPQVLRDASVISGSAGGSMFVTNPKVTGWTASKNSKPIADRFVTEGWYWRGKLMSRVHGSQHAGFLRDVDLFTTEELESEPIYRDNWRKIGLGWGTATAFALPGGQTISIVLSRETSKGPADSEIIGKLDLLRPHLARAALMSGRLQLERATAASQALGAIGLAALVFSEDGKVLAANSLLESLSGVLNWRAADRVTLRDSVADQLLRDALSGVESSSANVVRSFPVRGDEAQALLVGHLLPVRLSARDIFARSAAVFVLTPVAAPDALPVELVRSLFDLTPAEARVARKLVTGKSVDEIAADSGVSPNTIRAQVRGVLEKTGCARQTDVVALLGGVSLVGGVR
jgi:DNA-binding CsgD family transcriptional regulator